jgi:hypothetical protein
MTQDPIAPDQPTHVRVFTGYRPSPPEYYQASGVANPPDDPQYDGVVFPDGSVALRWRTTYQSTSVWDKFETFYHVHGHPEYGTRIDWRGGDHPHPSPEACAPGLTVTSSTRVGVLAGCPGCARLWRLVEQGDTGKLAWVPGVWSAEDDGTG